MFRIFWFVCFLAFAFGECPLNSVHLEDDPSICYSFHPTYTKFALAQRHCQSFGANLVTLKNDYVNVFVSQFAWLVLTEAESNYYWSGGHRLHDNDTYEWISGVEFNYENFRHSEQQGKNSLCVSVQLEQGGWKAEDCFNELPFACQFGANQNVTPKDAAPIDAENSTEPSVSPSDASITTAAVPLQKQTTNINENEEKTTVSSSIDNFSSFTITSTKTAPTNKDSIHESPSTIALSPHTTIEDSVSTTPSSSKVLCPDGWKDFNSFCYKIHPKMTWNGGEDACKKDDAHLLSIHSKAENDFIVGLIPSKSCDWEFQIWLGLEKINESFAWVDETPFDFKNWKVNEPNNYLGKESCSHIWITPHCGFKKDSEIGEWNDLNCEDDLIVICKKSKQEALTTTSQPTTNYFLSTTIPSTIASTVKESTTVTTTAVPLCPNGWVYYNETDHCYKLNENEPKSWKDAEAACQSEGGHLSSIHNDDEDNFVFGLVTNFTNPCEMSDQLWIGFSNKNNHSAAYEWSDASSVDYKNWGPTQPSNLYGNEHCACILASPYCSDARLWNDYDCTKALQYVCKKAAASSDLPTQSPLTDATKATTTKALVSTTTSSSKVLCPDGWKDFNNFCYKIHPKMTWTEGETICKKEDAHLLSIHSKAENDFITGLTSPKSCDWEFHIWLGLKKAANGTFKIWEDETLFDYNNWKHNEPNNKRGNETCGHIWVTPGCGFDRNSEPGEWNDLRCDHALTVVCKKSKDSFLLIPSTTPLSEAILTSTMTKTEILVASTIKPKQN